MNSMEPYQKVTVSELCQNLVPDLTSNIGTNGPNKFLLSRDVAYQGEVRAPIRFVWIQGYIINASKNEDILEVCDDLNVSVAKNSMVESAILVNCDKVPGKTTFKGRYCQVIGEIQGIDSSSKIRIRAIKIVDLDKEAVLQQAWPFEVEDFRRMFCKTWKGKKENL